MCRRDLQLWCAYAAFCFCVGLLLSVAELQHYLARGGAHPWEPFVWELGSVLVIGLLGVGVFRWHRWLRRQPGRLRLVGGHAIGLLVFSALHVALLLATRAPIYAALGVPYEPGTLQSMLGYETTKDSITYLVILGVSEGLLLFFADQRRRHEMETLRAELAEARLSRLVEQIQPHFLFNTLNLISSVMYEDVALADRLLCDLATLLRQALAAQQAGQHTLAQELALVEPYLAIMQSRFGERLQIAVEVSAQARECLLPSLLLIAPVENAIKHDVALSRDKVRVTVSARVEGGRLLLAVANSGMLPARDERAGAVGLANTRERLQTRYGAAAQVALSAGAEGGSLLSLSLPAESVPA